MTVEALDLALSCKATKRPVVTSCLDGAAAYGDLAGGEAVTITGVNFAGGLAESATVGGLALASFVVVNDTTITGAVPAGAAVGAVDVVVIGPGGNGTKVGGWTYFDDATVTSITPDHGPEAGGTAVTIVGTGFTHATSATINAVNIDAFAVVSDTEITGTAAAGTGTNLDVVVVSPFGNGTLAAAFDYDA